MVVLRVVLRLVLVGDVTETISGTCFKGYKQSGRPMKLFYKHTHVEQKIIKKNDGVADFFKLSAAFWNKFHFKK